LRGPDYWGVGSVQSSGRPRTEKIHGWTGVQWRRASRHQCSASRPAAPRRTTGREHVGEITWSSMSRSARFGRKDENRPQRARLPAPDTQPSFRQWTWPRAHAALARSDSQACRRERHPLGDVTVDSEWSPSGVRCLTPAQSVHRASRCTSTALLGGRLQPRSRSAARPRLYGLSPP
jgi:hypothetical protein